MEEGQMNGMVILVLLFLIIGVVAGVAGGLIALTIHEGVFPRKNRRGR